MAQKKRQTQVNNPKFVVADLVHIPQDVVLWCGHSPSLTQTTTTTAPTTGVVMDELPDTVVVFANGRRMHANKRHVYPYKEELR